jgi:hypothetical protein
MQNEDPNAVFDGLHPGVLKRSWRAADHSEFGSGVHFEDVLHQRKRTRIPEATEGIEFPEQVSGSTTPLPSNDISRLGFTGTPSNILNLPRPSNDFLRNNDFSSSQMWPQYSPIYPENRFSKQEIFRCSTPSPDFATNRFLQQVTLSSSSASLNYYTDELDPTEQCWPLEQAEQVFACPETDCLRYPESLLADEWACHSDIPQAPANVVPEVASLDMLEPAETWNQASQISMNMAADAYVWTTGGSVGNEMGGTDLLSLQPPDGWTDGEAHSLMCCMPDLPCNEIDEYWNTKPFTESLVDESTSLSQGEIDSEETFERNNLDECADDYSSGQLQAYRNQGSSDNSQLIEAEGISQAGYDTCFGMVR